MGIRNRILNGPVNFGESEPGIANCLFSNQVGFGASLLGIDSRDVTTSAFGTALGPIRPTDSLPLPLVNTNLLPPGYVSPPPAAVAAAPLDLRLLPNSPLVDIGQTPATWTNGTQFIRRYNSPCELDVLDNDCEGYGNPRVARNGIDIGADEHDQLLVTGYTPGTTTFASGATLTMFMNPFPAVTGPFLSFVGQDLFPVFVPGPTPWQEWSPTSVMGARGILTTTPTFVAGIGTQFFVPTILNPIGFTSSINPFPVVIGTGPFPAQSNLQALPAVPTGTASNLQTIFLP